MNKKWIALVPVVALTLGGATACQKKDKEYSRADTGIRTTQAETDKQYSRVDQADTRTGAPAAPAAGMRANPTPNTGAQAEASASATGQKILTGKMDVQDEDARTFIIEGNAQTYVAPQQADLDSLDGAQVTVHLDPNGRVQSIKKESDHES